MAAEQKIEQQPAEIDGLICAYLLDGGGGGKVLDWAGIRAWTPGDGILWVHLDRLAEPARAWTLNESGISAVTAESLLAEETRPRILVDGVALAVFLRGVNLNPGANPEDMVSVRAYVETQRIITLRHARLMAVNDLREAIDAGVGPKTSGEFLVQIADRTTRYVEDLEAARERAAAVQEEFNYQISERMNRTMYALTVVAAILLPPSLVAGLFGINVGGMPGVENGNAFWIVVGAITVLAVIEYICLRKLRWI